MLFTVQKQFFHSFHGCPAFFGGAFFLYTAGASSAVAVSADTAKLYAFIILYAPHHLPGHTFNLFYTF
jgi:hypothetical protein